MVMAKHPDPHVLIPDIVEKVVREPFKIAAPQPALIEMEESWILDRLPNSDLELGKEIVPQGWRYIVVAPEGLVQVGLDTPVEPSFHGS